MRIKSINISNFLSYENANIEFNHDSTDSPKIYVIDGMNLDSGDDGSNGSGKSSLVSESVFYNIYGRGLRGSKQRLKLNDMVRHGRTHLVAVSSQQIDDMDRRQCKTWDQSCTVNNHQNHSKYA